MILRPPISTRNDTLLPYTTLFRSEGGLSGDLRAGRRAGERNGREGEAPEAQLAAERYAHDFHFLGSPLTAPRRWPHRCGCARHGQRREQRFFHPRSGRCRSEERRVWKECVRTFRSRWSPAHYNKNTQHHKHHDTTISLTNTRLEIMI